MSSSATPSTILLQPYSSSTQGLEGVAAFLKSPKRTLEVGTNIQLHVQLYRKIHGEWLLPYMRSYIAHMHDYVEQPMMDIQALDLILMTHA